MFHFIIISRNIYPRRGSSLIVFSNVFVAIVAVAELAKAEAGIELVDVCY